MSRAELDARLASIESEVEYAQRNPGTASGRASMHDARDMIAKLRATYLPLPQALRGSKS